MTQILENLIELLSVTLGLIIVFITYRAAKLNSQRYLYYLSIGFAIISLGSLVEALFSQLLENFSVRQDHLLESIFVNIGFVIIWIALKEVNGTGSNEEDVPLTENLETTEEEIQ